MTLRHPDRTAPDPFWDVVRRRHPDLAPLLLPPDAAPRPRPAVGEPVSDDVVLAAQRDATGLHLTLLAQVGQGPPDEPPPTGVLRPGPGRLTLEAATTTVLRDHPDGHGSLTRLAEALDGWSRRLAPGRVARLEARLGGRVVAASYVEDERVLVLSVVSAPLPVTREQSHRLRSTRATAREVTS